MIATRPNHYAIAVADLEASAAWYARVFGFERIAAWPVPDVDTKAAMLRRGDFQIELFERAESKRPPAPQEGVMGTFLRVGLSHIAFTVDDLSVVRAELARLGVEEVTAVNQNPVLKDHWVFIQDPNGVYIELVEEA